MIGIAEQHMKDKAPFGVFTVIYRMNGVGTVGEVFIDEDGFFFVPDYLSDWSMEPVRPTKEHYCFSPKDIQNISRPSIEKDRAVIEIGTKDGNSHTIDCKKNEHERKKGSDKNSAEFNRRSRWDTLISAVIAKGCKQDERICNRMIAFFIVCVMTAGLSPAAFPVSYAGSEISGQELSAVIDKTAGYLTGKVTNPVISSIGGEWAVLGLARSGADVPESYYDRYYDNAAAELRSNEGILSNVKYTEYSRLILALTAIGRDVADVGGYNLLEKLADYNRVIKQGINGPIFALIALDSRDYTIPQISGVTVQTTREMLVDYILSREVIGADGVRGGFSLSGDAPDADITGMALQALSNYQSRSDVKAAIDRALLVLEKIQLANGSFENYGTETLESIVQVIVAKSALGVDASVNVSALMAYSLDDGSMEHTISGGANLMATEQGFYALVSYARYKDGRNSLYDMTDTVNADNTAGTINTDSSADKNTGTVGAIKVILNGEYLNFKQAPVNTNGRYYSLI